VKLFKHLGRGGVLSCDMKTQALLLTLSVAAAGISSAHAQVFRPSAVANGAVIGGIAGAFIGGHNHDRWGEGALIGAAAGALLGAAVDQQPRQIVYSQPVVIQPVAVVADVSAVYMTPAPVYVQAQPEPQVVYVQPAPQRVVYVQEAPRVIYVSAPPVRRARVVVVVAPPRHRYEREIVYVAPGCPRW
jgi:hypothetical protein